MTEHLSDDDLSRFLAGENAGAEEHLSLCTICRSRLVDSRFTEDLRPLSTELLEKAKRMGQRTTSGSLWKWATAAMFVMIIAGVSVMRVQSDREEVMRDVAPKAEAPHLLAPDDGSREATEVRWTPVAGAMRYEVRILDARGDVIVEESTTEAQLSLARWVGRLRKGESYFWSVRARWPDGRIADSEIRSFVAD